MGATLGNAEVRLVLEAAEQAAREESAPEVRPEHVLLGLARARPGILASILDRYEITPDSLLAALPRREPGNGGAGTVRAAKGPLPPAPEIAAAVARAGGAAGALGRGGFDATDLLIALLQDRASRATELLAKRFGLSCESLANDLKALRGQERAIAKVEGGDACGREHEAEAAGVDAAAAGGVGLAAELRDLEARHRALCENVKEMLERQRQLTAVVRNLWVVSLVALAGLAAVAYFVMVRRPG